MERNNGKIAIAIVAMFVVALSIVGFTYAYFTAQVNGNTGNDSVQVTAGELVITYNNTKSIAAANIVPGWISDGKTFYDPVYSIKQFGTDRGVTAVKTTDFAVKEGTTDQAAEGKLAAKPSVDTAATTVIGGKTYSAYGLTAPATFNVVNEGDYPAAYEVEITATTTIDDTENVHVYLYEADTAAALEALDVTDDDVKAGAEYHNTLDVIGTGKVAIKSRTLTTAASGNAKYYMLVVEYKEISNPQDNSQKYTIKKNL